VLVSRLTVSGGKECPMCGGMMRLKRTEQSVPVAGKPRPSTKISAEWICPECDYFEEAEEDRG
jgi:C4-type Zn-finger protein